MAEPSDRERIARLESRAREAETALQQVKSYVELLKRKAGKVFMMESWARSQTSV